MPEDSKDQLSDVLARIDHDVQYDSPLTERIGLRGWTSVLSRHFEMWAGDEAVEYAQHDWHEWRESDLAHSRTGFIASPGLTLFVLTRRYAYIVVATKRPRTLDRPQITAAHMVRRDAISSLVAAPPELDYRPDVERHPLLIDVQYEGYSDTIHIPSMLDRADMVEVDPSLLWKLRDDRLAKHQWTSTEPPTPSDPS